MNHVRGLTVVELMTLMAVMVVALAVLLPRAAQLRTAGRGEAAARELATEFHGLRWRSVAVGRNHGMFFDRDGEGWYWLVVRDENGNGLRTAEVRDRTDSTLSGPHRIEHRVDGVRLGFPEGGAYPRIPPRVGDLGPTDDPVRFGAANLISFSPLGSSSSGTLYLTDGADRLLGVVLFGPTVRVRVWRFDRRSGRWNL